MGSCDLLTPQEAAIIGVSGATPMKGPCLEQLFGPGWPLTYTDADWGRSLDATRHNKWLREVAEAVWEEHLLEIAVEAERGVEARARGEPQAAPIPRLSPPPLEPDPFEHELIPWHAIVSEALCSNILPTRAVAHVFAIASSPCTALEEYLDNFHCLPDHLIRLPYSAQETRASSSSPSPTTPSHALEGRLRIAPPYESSS